MYDKWSTTPHQYVTHYNPCWHSQTYATVNRCTLLYITIIASPMQCLNIQGWREQDTTIPSVPHSTACTLLHACMPNLNVVHHAEHPAVQAGQHSCLMYTKILEAAQHTQHNLRLTSRSPATLNSDQWGSWWVHLMENGIRHADKGTVKRTRQYKCQLSEGANVAERRQTA